MNSEGRCFNGFRGFFVAVFEATVLLCFRAASGFPGEGPAYFLFVDGAKSRPWDVERFLGISPEQALRIWDIMLRTYYETDDEAVLKEKEEQIRLFSLFKVALNPAIWPNASAQAVEAFVNTARDRLFPLLEKNY